LQVLRLAQAIVKLILGPFISEIGLAPADTHPPFSLCLNKPVFDRRETNPA
jgi:hypothetical protein